MTIAERHMTIEEWFKIGMKRDLVAPLPWDMTLAFDLGAGNTPTPGAVALDLPDWHGDFDDLPCEFGSATCIIAHHFFEHLTGESAIRMLRECSRAMAVGATLNIVTPYYNAQIQAKDLTHKSAWCEETWRILFNNKYYTHGGAPGWKLRVHTCFIIGIVERNIALFTQLVKE